MYINYAITSDGKKSPVVSSTDFINGAPASEYALKSSFAYNLLDNSDFTNPINQRGATTTTAWQYCLDRWIARISNMELSVSNNGLTLTSTAIDGYIYQKLKNPEKYLGKTYTFAICNSEEDILTATFTFPNSIPTSWTGFIDIKKDNMRIYCFGSKSLAVGFGINDTNASTVTIKWAALYEGEYTTETLPPYVSKGCAVEALNCGIPMHPRNLLDNSYFINPINQRGQSYYSSDSKVYTLDRWELTNAHTTQSNMELNEDGSVYYIALSCNYG
jgi:hypothetical protein